MNVLLGLATALLATSVASPPLAAANDTFEEFRSALSRPIKICLASADKRFKGDDLRQAVELAAARYLYIHQFNQRDPKENPPWVPQFVGSEKWNSAAHAAASADGVDTAVVIKRAKSKKGKTIAQNYSPTGYGNSTSVQYTGVLVTVSFGLDIRSIDGAESTWTGIAKWKTEKDVRRTPFSLSKTAIEDRELVVAAHDVFADVIATVALQVATKRCHTSIMTPPGRLAEWVNRLAPDEELAFWSRAAALPARNVFLDRRAMAEVALSRWRSLETQGAGAEHGAEIVDAIRRYCDESTTPSREAERTAIRMGMELDEIPPRTMCRLAEMEERLEAIFKARSEQPIHRITDRFAINYPRVLVHEKLLPGGLMIDAPSPTSVWMHVATFTDEDQDVAKKTGREYLLKIKGAALIDRVDGHVVIVRKLKKNDVSTESLLGLLHESLVPRWPGVE